MHTCHYNDCDILVILVHIHHLTLIYLILTDHYILVKLTLIYSSPRLPLWCDTRPAPAQLLRPRGQFTPKQLQCYTTLKIIQLSATICRKATMLHCAAMLQCATMLHCATMQCAAMLQCATICRKAPRWEDCLDTCIPLTPRQTHVHPTFNLVTWTLLYTLQCNASRWWYQYR